MKISKMLAWSAGAALALSATVLAAQGYGPMMRGGQGCGPMMGGGGGMVGHLERFLNLTEAQKTELKAIETRHQVSLDAKLKASGEVRDEMHKAMRDPAVNDARIKELHTKVADAMTAVLLERRAMQRELEALLTPEQKTILDQQRLQGGPGGPGGRMGGWGGRGCF